MKELFREPDSARIGFCQSILDAEGIATFVRNEPISGLNVNTALFVMNDEDHDRALAILETHFANDAAKSEDEVPCPACGEPNPGNFEVCWSCGAGMDAGGRDLDPRGSGL